MIAPAMIAPAMIAPAAIAPAAIAPENDNRPRWTRAVVLDAVRRSADRFST
jgi:hypothetical protein